MSIAGVMNSPKIACLNVNVGNLLHHIHKHTFPLPVPPTTQSLVGWKTETAGTAVMPSPPS